MRNTTEIGSTCDGSRVGRGYGPRHCPTCLASEPGSYSVRSTPAAEDLDFAELLRMWNTDIFTKKGYFSYFRCSGCGLLYCPEYPDATQLARLYGAMSPNMQELPMVSLQRTQSSYLRTALRHLPPEGDIIEIGPDRGILAREMANRPELKFERFWFIEPNASVHEPLRAAAAPKPAQILSDLNEYESIPSATAAMAFMVHVLDHLTDPLHHLRQLHRCLKAGGLLNIVVHNERSVLAKVFGPNHPIYCPYHPQLYNATTLADVVRRASFTVLEVVPTRNYYPINYLLKNALFRAGLGLHNLPMMSWLILPMPLGNIQLVARK